MDRNDELAMLVPEIRAVLARMRVSKAELYRHRRAAGEKLRRAKELVPHGRWEKFLAKYFELTVRTAERWIKFSKTDAASDLASQARAWNRINGHGEPPDDDEPGTDPATGEADDPPDDDQPPAEPKRPRPPLDLNDDFRLPVNRVELGREFPDVPKDTTLTDAHYRPELVFGVGGRRGPADVYRPDGSLLLAFRPRAVGVEVCRVAFPGLRRAARSSGHLGGEKAGTVGFFDHPGSGPRVAAFTRDYPDEMARIAPYLRALDEVFRLAVPDRYAHQLAAVATDRRFVLPGTVFTTVTANNNVQYPAHQHPENLPGSLAVMGMFRAGSFRDGRFVLPRWGVAVEMKTRDVLIADVSETHGVEAFVPDGDDPEAGCERITVVAYVRTALVGLRVA